MTKPITRKHLKRYGGGSTAEDMWYDKEIITVKEGDKCPECEKGIMKVSKRNKLYCSEICWKAEEAKRERLFNECVMESEHGDWEDR